MSEVYQFSVEHATLYGVTEAIILRNLILNIRSNKNNGRHHIEAKDGSIRWWSYNKYDAFVATFPFWTRDQIRYGISSLLKQGVIYMEKHAQDKSDQRNWFALTDESMLDLFSGGPSKNRVVDSPPPADEQNGQGGESAYQGGTFTTEAGSFTGENEAKGGTFTKQGGESAKQGELGVDFSEEGGKITSQGGKSPNSYKVLEEFNETTLRNTESREKRSLRDRGESASGQSGSGQRSNPPPRSEPEGRIYVPVNIAESNSGGAIFKAIVDDPAAGRVFTLSKQSYANLQRWFKECGREKFIAGCRGFLEDSFARQNNYRPGLFEKNGPDGYIRTTTRPKARTNDDYPDNKGEMDPDDFYRTHPEMYDRYPEYAPKGYVPGPWYVPPAERNNAQGANT